MDVVVPPVKEKISAAQFIRHERMKESIMAESADIVVLPVNEATADDVQTAMEMEIVEVFQPLPQEHTQKRIGKQRVTAPVPPNKEEIAEVLQPPPQEQVQDRVKKQRVQTRAFQPSPQEHVQDGLRRRMWLLLFLLS